MLDALVEAWNRELTPLLNALRRGLLDALGVTVSITADDSPYTVLSNGKFIRADATDGEVVVLLREATEAENSGVQFLIVKKLDSSGNAVTVTADGTQDIDGATTAPLTSQYESIEIWPRTEGYDIA